MRFGVLGPLMVEDHGARMTIPSTQVRALLARLLADANTVVPAAELEHALWGREPPASSRASLHNQVMRLRRHLGPEQGARVQTAAPGYLLVVHDGELDEQLFADACARGRTALEAGDWAAASAELAAAAALWRGEPGCDLPDSATAPGRIHRLVELRLQACRGRIDAELNLGRHHELIAQIRTLTSEYPLMEDFHGQLMLALYRCGRQAEALDAYQRLHRTLVDELAVQPSPAVRDLHHRILNRDRTLDAPGPDPGAVPAGPAGSGPGGADPSGPGGARFQLPADTRVFTGRAGELEQVIGLARQAPAGTEAGMVVISAIDGLGGMGKTALAVHAAHRLRDAFPDGQLFADLHGHTPGLEPTTPGDALDWFLRSLGTPPGQIPQDLAARAAFYRDRLAGTRTLIILDNAAGPAQIRPLLPGSPGCLVLITSRKRLNGLEDANMLPLDVMSEDDAAVLLRRVAGPGRVPAGHPSLAQLVELCGYMPLAVRMAGARLRHHRSLRIEDLVNELRDEHSRLEHLQDPDRTLATVFESSYASLAPAEQRMFRLLGLIPGSDLDVYAAAAVAGTDYRPAERLVESLLDHSLLMQNSPGRYQFHDLVRIYARGLAAGEPAADRDGALDRLLDYYLYTADAADRHLLRYRRPGPDPAVTAPASTPAQPDRAAALLWMRAERTNLLDAVHDGATLTRPAHVIGLSCALAAYLRSDGFWEQAAALHRGAAETAVRHGDRLGQANALYDLCRVPNLAGELASGIALREQILALYLELGDRQGEANAVFEMGRMLQMAGDYPAALDLQQRALTLYQALGDRVGEADTFDDLGRIRQLIGDYEIAAGLHERALVLYRELGDHAGEAAVRHDLGRIRFATGHYADGIQLLEQSLATARSLGNRHAEADCLHDLGRGESAMGHYAAAADLQEAALALYEELGFRLNGAHALRELGRVRFATGDHAAAQRLLDRALAVFLEVGMRLGEANALHDLGRIRQAAGDVPGAARCVAQALAIYRELGHRHGEVEALVTEAGLTAVTAGPDRALVLYGAALRLARELHSPLDEAKALEGGALCAHRAGDRTAASADLGEAVAIFERIGAPEAGPAAARLAALRAEGPAGD
jgi:DNA-binding SARP family transcriptional activator/tetratricopeptide (TPR) repeat protein